MKLPSGWAIARLGEVISPRTERVHPSDHPDARFLRMDHIEGDSTRILGWLPASSMKSAAFRFYRGDVLYGRLRPYLNKVARPHFDGLASAEFIVFPDTDVIHSSFLKHRLNAADFVRYASNLNEGDRPRVKFGQLAEFRVLIPPRAEQVRIAAKIEALFSELDKGIELLKNANAQLYDFRQTLLRYAFEGKLTKQWRKENKDSLETSEQLVARIKQERDATYEQQLRDWKSAFVAWEKGGGAGRRPPKPSEFEVPAPFGEDELTDLPTVPQSWQYVRLSEIADIGSGMSVSRTRELSDPITIPYLSVANVQRGELDLSRIKTMRIERTQLPALKLKGLDVLFNEGGDRDKLGRGWIWESQIEPCITQNHVFRASPFLVSRKHSKWISQWGNSFGQRYFELQGKQTTNLASINKTVLRKFPIPLPPIKEQEEILHKIDIGTTTLDQIAKGITVTLRNIDALRQSILSKSFSGQLVTQDCSDEPASVLLERIRAEREQTVTRSVSGKTRRRQAARSRDGR